MRTPTGTPVDFRTRFRQTSIADLTSALENGVHLPERRHRVASSRRKSGAADPIHAFQSGKAPPTPGRGCHPIDAPATPGDHALDVPGRPPTRGNASRVGIIARDRVHPRPRHPWRATRGHARAAPPPRPAATPCEGGATPDGRPPPVVEARSGRHGSGGREVRGAPVRRVALDGPRYPWPGRVAVETPQANRRDNPARP